LPFRPLPTAARILALALIALPAFGGSATQPVAAADAPIVMKIGTATLNDPQHEWIKRYKTAVERDSHGRIQVQIYPASQLGSVPREIEGTQFGSIQGWVGPSQLLIGVDPRYQVLSTPGIFRDTPQFNRVLADKQFSSAFLALGADKGLKGVALFFTGPNSWITRKPVRTLSDLNGMKIRVLAGPLEEQAQKALGATGVPMPLDQVAPALQQGAIDGIITTIVTATPLKYYSEAPYDLDANPSYLGTVAVLSKSWFDRLPADLQKVLVDDGPRVGHDLTSYTTSFLADAEKQWVAGGGKITHLSPADQKTMIEKLKPVGPNVFNDKPAVKQMYDELQAAIARAH
jgi:TRAP-type C4-dicarboxylate transport system substrate-binding protein